MEKCRINQHQRRKSQRDCWPYRRQLCRHDAEHNYQAIGHIEIAPFCRQMENIASPISPIENELFKYVDSICGKAEPQQRLKFWHNAF